MVAWGREEADEDVRGPSHGASQTKVAVNSHDALHGKGAVAGTADVLVRLLETTVLQERPGGMSTPLTPYPSGN
ncbi:hypothetical protein GCM10007874_58120 [Labrys miyagiensis]|uniref:Uncharacterized protein n=1 Tax=Labrys miyagiensis TaxID=346912 RepID=A0ABQ6CT96_9HYPH|nr:hypothetical protein GCM10007874_58120 [Labrys miyagiensis]